MWLAFQCAALFRATVLAHEKRPISASLRPLDIYIYVFGSQSCATRLIFAGSAPLLGHRLRRLRFASGDTGCGPETKPRVAPLVEFVAERRTSASLPLPAPSLPASSRRYAPPCFVGGIPPSRLATCTTAHPPNRAVSCRSARHSARRSASSLHVKPLQAIPTTTNRLYRRRQITPRQIRCVNTPL